MVDKKEETTSREENKPLVVAAMDAESATTKTIDESASACAPSVSESASASVSDPLNIDDKCQVRWRDGEANLDAVVVERRPVGYRKRRKLHPKPPKEQGEAITTTTTTNTTTDDPLSIDVRNLLADEIEYYVHYVNHDRRLDEWITLEKFALNKLERQQPKIEQTESIAQEGLSLAVSADMGDGNNDDENDNDNNNNNTNNNNQSSTPINLTVGGNWHGNSGDPTLAGYEREHEETTKVKNIEKIVMGEWEVEAWYYSPFPEEYSNIETLYVCEFCLTYMRKVRTYKHHKQTCTCREPPGRKIYSDPVGGLAVYELDGKQHRGYCQKLCLLAKLFLDHKTLFYDSNPFYFYVVTQVDEQGAHIVGYFSKEKVSSEGYNLACILTFPQFQKEGYGKFIISISYELSKREAMAGSPEKPLSDLGKVSYRSYWKHVLFNLLAEHDTSKAETEDISIAEMSARTGIKTEDILSTLQALDMIKVWKGQHVVYVDQRAIQEYMDQRKKFRLCIPECLHWAPLPPSPTSTDDS